MISPCFCFAYFTVVYFITLSVPQTIRDYQKWQTGNRRKCSWHNLGSILAHLPAVPEWNNEPHWGVPAKVQTRHIPNINLQQQHYTNLIGSFTLMIPTSDIDKKSKPLLEVHTWSFSSKKYHFLYFVFSVIMWIWIIFLSDTTIMTHNTWCTGNYTFAIKNINCLWNIINLNDLRWTYPPSYPKSKIFYTELVQLFMYKT
jgi:hypothetical protein